MASTTGFKARVEYKVTDGTKTTYTFPFTYLRKKFVMVSILHSNATETALKYGVDYKVNGLSVSLTTPAQVGEHIIIYRQTSTDNIVTWNDGSILLARDMNTEDVQRLHLQEEQQDYIMSNAITTTVSDTNEVLWDALGHRIINVGDPKDPQNVVTKHYMENVQSGFVKKNTDLVNEATKQASAAKSSQTAAESSESNAATYASKANTSNISAKNWAMSVSSPDNAEDTKSKTGKTQSSRSWALQAEESVNNINFYMFNILKRGTRYSVGDIAYTPLLKSYLYLECVTAGTTQSSHPSFSGKAENSLINDGTVVWKVMKVTPQAYVDSNFLPLSGGALTNALRIDASNKGVLIKEREMLATSSSTERYTDIISHTDKNDNRFFFLRSGVKKDNDKYVELTMMNRNNTPVGGISLYYDASKDAVSVNISGKEIKTLFYPYYSIQWNNGGFTRFDGLQIFYTWIEKGKTYTYPKPFSDIPRVFVQYLTGSNAPNFENTSKTSFTNVGSNDCYLLAIGKGV